ncbi:MAG: fumarate/nitrate reduction transcriptional regulator Fnr [Colwellia sp.]
MPNTTCQRENHIQCNNCSMSELCLPFSLETNDLTILDNIIDRKRPIHKGENIFNDGEHLHAIYAIRSGTFKTYIVNEQGEEQITGFHLAGELLGFDAIAEDQHKSFAQALETSMVCEIPYEKLDNLVASMPSLRKQMFRLMSNEINVDQDMLSLLNRKNAEQRVATFLVNLSERYHDRNLSSKEFRLTMTRSDIGNYIGLTVETISRLLNRFHKNGLIELDGKLIKLIAIDELTDIAES